MPYSACELRSFSNKSDTFAEGPTATIIARSGPHDGCSSFILTLFHSKVFVVPSFGVDILVLLL
jgi:hypothetical protein